MIDYTNNGASNPTGNQKLIFVERDMLVGASSYSVGFYARRTRSPAANTQVISERNDAVSGGNKGWHIYCSSTYYLYARNGNGASWSSMGPTTDSLTVDTLYFFVFTWNGADWYWWRNGGAAQGSGSASNTIADPSAQLTIGADDGNVQQGFAGQLGKIIVWRGRVLSQSDVAALYDGIEIPYAEDARFYHPCTGIPGSDEYAQEIPSQNGNLWIKSLDPPDSYYPNGIATDQQIKPWRDVFSRELRRRRFPEEIYTMSVPLEYLALEILDDLNISHDSLPRAESLLTDIDDHYLMDKWRSMYVACTAQRINLNSMEMELDFINLEPFICYAWSTDILPYAVTSDYDGLAQIDQCATWNVERASSAWAEQADGLIATLASGVARIGANGFLPCEGSDNPIQNSTFYYDSGGPPYFPGWTPSANFSGSADTGNPLFVDDETYPNAVQILKSASGDSYLEQTVAVSSSDGHRMLQFWYHNELTVKGVLSYQIYRAAGEYWNNSTPDWQGGSVWNPLGDGSIWTLAYSEPVSTPASENWTIRFGVVTGDTSSGAEVAQAQLNEGRYVLAPIPTIVGDTYTTETDERYFEFDNNSTENHRICVPLTCGTFRCRFTAINDYDRMSDGDVLVIGYAQFDSTGDDYDLYCYEKQSGSNHRFALKRYLSGGLDATAYKDVQVAAGTSYEVAFRWITDELGLSAFTLSVFADGVKGTDDQASSAHSCDDYSELCPDPTCATDFFDSKGTGWSHDASNDEYDCDGSQVADSDLTEGSICTSSVVYRVEFEIKNYSAGNLCAVCGTQEGTDRSASGVYSEYITASGTNFIIRADADFVGSVTNIYIHRDKYSSFHIGTAPSVTGYLAANNYIANWEIIQRAIPDEEIQARR